MKIVITRMTFPFAFVVINAILFYMTLTNTDSEADFGYLIWGGILSFPFSLLVFIEEIIRNKIQGIHFQDINLIPLFISYTIIGIIQYYLIGIMADKIFKGILNLRKQTKSIKQHLKESGEKRT
jgi:hypothetical protein